MGTTPEQIATRAYERFLERGGKHGHDLEDWLAAKEELRSRERYEVHLVDPGARVIEVVRTIRGLTGMGLREAEDLVHAPPGTLARDASAADAEVLRARLEAVGARVTMLPR